MIADLIARLDFSDFAGGCRSGASARVRLSEPAVRAKSLKVLESDRLDSVPEGLLSGSAIVAMLWKEVNDVNRTHPCFDVVPLQDSLFCLDIVYRPQGERLKAEMAKLSAGGGIRMRMTMPKRLYPFEPPSLEVTYPRFARYLNYGITTMDYFRAASWNPTNTLEYTLTSIADILEREADVGDEEQIEYSELERALDQLSRITKIRPAAIRPDTLKVHFVPIQKHAPSKSTGAWASGTGYGTSSSSTWDIQEYIKQDKYRASRTAACLSEVRAALDAHDGSPDAILRGSCLATYINEALCITELSQSTELVDLIADVHQRCPDLLRPSHRAISAFNQQCVDCLRVLGDNLEIRQMHDKLHAAAKAAAKEAEEGATEKEADSYEAALRELQVLPGSGFGREPNSGATDMRRLLKEIHSWKDSMPLSASSSVFVRYDEDKLGSFRFLVTGPKDTPYENGCFLFTMTAFDGYPNNPPRITMETTGQGTVRFNPNLYANGKVCLSLLGTWSGSGGEKWNPTTSTMLQVMVSIQSLIFIEQPFFNEPGYENGIGSWGEKQSESYNKNIRKHTVQWAMVDMLRNPPPEFRDVVHAHFRLKKDEVLERVRAWDIDTAPLEKALADAKL
jgi:ubiquitin-protein ligase